MLYFKHESLTYKKIKPIFAKRHIRYAAIFGSRAIGQATPNSDYDFLIEYDPEFEYSLLDLADVKQTLEDALRQDVDIITSDAT